MLFTLREEGFIAQRYRFDGTVTVVDAGHIEQQLAAQYEAVKQVALADLLVVSKGIWWMASSWSGSKPSWRP